MKKTYLFEKTESIPGIPIPAPGIHPRNSGDGPTPDRGRKQKSRLPPALMHSLRMY